MAIYQVFGFYDLATKAVNWLSDKSQFEPCPYLANLNVRAALPKLNDEAQ